jgi:hypothetical protein
MKKIIFIFLTFCCYSQNIIISNENLNVVYVGIDNPIVVNVENCSCDKITVSVNNGKVLNYLNCKFVVRSDSEGEILFEVFKNKKSVGRKVFRAIKIEARLKLDTSSNVVENSDIINATSLRLSFDNFSIDFSYKLTYKVIIISSNEIVYNEYINNNKFSAILRKKISEMKIGDILLFHDIQAIMLNQEEAFNLNNLSYTFH